MSSTSILAARVDMLLRKNWRTGSVAPFSAIASLSLSTWRISVCAEPASSLTRSSKVNISVLMRSAASRFSSSSEVMKRVSVWRSKLLKISAITSCASRAAGLRQVRHEFGAQRLLDPLDHVLLHRFHPQHARDDVEREFLGQDREHARGMLGADLREHDRDGLRIFVLQIVGEHLFLHVGELLPHVAAGGSADFLHDVGDAVGRQELVQQPFGRVEIAQQRAGRREPADEFEQQAFDLRRSTVPSVDIDDRKLAQFVVVEQLPDLVAVLSRRARASAPRRAPGRSGARRRFVRVRPGGSPASRRDSAISLRALSVLSGCRPWHDEIAA